jgi:hypothetical protein
VLVDCPVLSLLEVVVMSTEHGEIVPVGGTGGVGDGVVEVAAVRRLAAARESAALVAAADECGECGGGSVATAAGVDDGAGGVGGQPAPQAVGGQVPGHVGGDGAEAGKLAGVVGGADDGGQRNGEADQRGRPAGSGAPSCDQVDQSVGPPLVGGSDVRVRAASAIAVVGAAVPAATWPATSWAAAVRIGATRVGRQIGRPVGVSVAGRDRAGRSR